MSNFDNLFPLTEEEKEKDRQNRAIAEALAQQAANPPDMSQPIPINIPQSMLPEPEKPKSLTSLVPHKAKKPASAKKAAAAEEPKENSTEVPTAPGSSPLELLLSGNKDSLEKAEGAKNLNQLLAVLGKSGSEIGSAISMAPKAADTSGFDALFKVADQPVKDFDNRQDSLNKALKGFNVQEGLKNEIAKEDPKSEISKIGRQILADVSKQAGSNFDLPENISLSNMEKLLPGIENMANRRLQAQALAQRTHETQNMKNDQFNRMLGQRIESQTNNQVKSETGDYVRNLDQANRTQDIFKDIKAGKYKSSSNIASALQSDISALLTGAKQTAVYDRSHAEIKALEKTWNEMLSYAQSKPKDTIPATYMRQLEEEVETLKHAVLKNYDRKTKELESGTKYSEKKDIINNRFATQLNQLGYDPTTLQPKSQVEASSPEDKEAIEWANANKSDPRAKQILKMHGME